MHPDRAQGRLRPRQALRIHVDAGDDGPFLQKPTHRGGAEMNVWMSDKGLSTPVEQDGIVFVEAEGVGPDHGLVRRLHPRQRIAGDHLVHRA